MTSPQVIRYHPPMIPVEKSGLTEKTYIAKTNALKIIQERLKRPLTLAEKILFSHLKYPESFHEEEDFLSLLPDRVIMQDVTAQMALLQFMLTGKTTSDVPASIHCDHLIIAKAGLKKDMEEAKISNREVFDFLSSAAELYDIDFWEPGSGIIHQVVLEKYAFPGALIIGTDSHTPNAGGLGTLAVGVGGADATDVMAGFPFQLKRPEIIGVHLTGQIQGWASPKDVILKLLGILTVKGGTNKVIEYFGEGTKTLSCTGKATITNMGAELGATSSVFPFDERMEAFLNAGGRTQTTRLSRQYESFLQADREVLKSPKDFYDQVIEINLSELEPHLSGPHSPDRVRPLKDIKKELKEEGWPVQLSAALIGSCTNSSYEDIGRAVHIAKQASKKSLKMPQPFLVTPGSEQIKRTIQRDGYMEELEKVGALVLANACGPCIGQWSRGLKKGHVNTILNSFNRNFKGRNDGSSHTLSFIASPEVVMAMGLAGRLDFDPETDTLKTTTGENFKFQAPQAEELPPQGFVSFERTKSKPQSQKKTIHISPESQRLQKLTPFPAWDGEDFTGLLLLCKARGKCTTDHICPAGYWLKYRGHLDKISDNLLMGAVNDWTGESGRGKNVLTGAVEEFSKMARHYKREHQGWVIIGDENYGEGSSREHAAMTPRHLGAKAVIAKSFARIHETNLKKQGLLPLTFVNPSDYKIFQPESLIAIKELQFLKEKSDLIVEVTQKTGEKQEIPVRHSLNPDQVEWFKAGSSLNFIRQKSA